MAKNKFSKDPKVTLVSLEYFLEHSNYLFFDVENCVWNHIWKGDERPHGGIYYKITPRMLIKLYYTLTRINFGMDLSEKLVYIEVAYRDGKKEFELFDLKMKELLDEKSKRKRRKKINENIDETLSNLEIGLNMLKSVKYSESTIVEPKNFEDFIIDIDYITQYEQLKDKYVVFDVETNGLRRANDDLLSISIYDPSNGKCYNRYLPLDLQPLVLTGWINGITDKKLESATHITQDELNKVIESFDLKNKILLSFSGGNGTFDSTFIINYCKRHNLIGFENLKYENIKSIFPDADYGSEGLMSKDNLCKLLKIEGVQDIHSSINDCILEWKLFEKMKAEHLFFINEDLFKYHEDYIIPVSYLNRYPKLANFANIKVPYIVGEYEVIFDFSLPNNILKKVKKFPTNITGISLENGINSILNVDEQDNREFLVKNKSQLEYIGSLGTRLTKIPVEAQKDGTMKSLDNQYDEYVKKVNDVTKLVTNCLSPVFNFIKTEIFTSGKIMSQELSVSEDGKVFALCDLSDEENVLEIKTFKLLEEDGSISDKLARQLYYQSRGRKTFALSIDIDIKKNGRGESVANAVNVRIYKITLKESEPKPIERTLVLYDYEIKILKLIKENPFFTNVKIAKLIDGNPNRIGRIVKRLVSLKYIIKEDETKRSSKWIMLRDIDDIETKYSYFNGETTFIFDNESKNE